MIVMKFGGTSVGNSAMVKEVAGIVKQSYGLAPVVVVSAVSKMTDLLMESAKNAEKGKYNDSLAAIRERHSAIMSELGMESSLISNELLQLENSLKKISASKRLSSEDMDSVASFGERLSSKIVAEALRKEGVPAQSYNSCDLGMVTDENFGAAEVLPEAYSNLKNSISKIPKGTVPVITGFIGRAGNGKITTLGRGGSDYSASIIGAAIGAEEVQIWTDVDGIMTADPRVVPTAKTVGLVSFDEASELSYFGAKVLHPKTILPVISRNIPVRILNTYNPSSNGTLIVREINENAGEITSIACKKGISVININSPRMLMMPGFLHKVFKIFDKYSTSVDMVSTSEVNVSLTLETKSVRNIDKLIGELGENAVVNVENSKASICVVGKSIKRVPGISAKLFSALAAENINIEMISQGASEINIGAVISEEEADDAVRALHKAFFA